LFFYVTDFLVSPIVFRGGPLKALKYCAELLRTPSSIPALVGKKHAEIFSTSLMSGAVVGAGSGAIKAIQIVWARSDRVGLLQTAVLYLVVGLSQFRRRATGLEFLISGFSTAIPAYFFRQKSSDLDFVEVFLPSL
jgi:hypothetical protein